MLADGGAVLPLFVVDRFGQAWATDGETSSLGCLFLAFAEKFLMVLRRCFAGSDSK
jgi:hypothetical protein